MQSLKGMDERDYAINRVLMVGALYEGNRLADNDHLLLRIAVQTLGAAGFGFSNTISTAALNRLQPLTNSGVDIFNIREDMGGRDFLKEKPKGDLVIFCNIPREENAEYSKTSRSFDLSARQHEAGIWREVTKQTGAKAVVAFGGLDCLHIGDFSETKTYHPVFMTPTGGRADGHVIETLVTRDILQNGEAFFSSIGAPMEKACIDYQESPNQLIALNVALGPRGLSRANLGSMLKY